jgi:hypothetical protein
MGFRCPAGIFTIMIKIILIIKSAQTLRPEKSCRSDFDLNSEDLDHIADRSSINPRALNRFD